MTMLDDDAKAAIREIERRGKDPAPVAQQTLARQEQRKQAWMESARHSIQTQGRYPFKMALKTKEDGSKNWQTTEEDPTASVCRLFETTGCTDRDAAQLLLAHITMAMPNPEDEDRVNGALALMADIAPRDGLEGMLAAQAVTSHTLAMQYAKRAMAKDSNSLEANDRYISRYTKLLNLFAKQVDTLEKYRNKGQQRITVQHVQVNQGGQAIVGEVHHGH
ncbi:MAG: hypothetical protein AB7P76_07515 [Candidatus Melainabacteria bacterium]